MGGAWICEQCAFNLEELSIGHCRREACQVCGNTCSSDDVTCSSDEVVIPPRGGYYSIEEVIKIAKRKHAELVDARLTIDRLATEAATCLELLKPFNRVHVDEPLPKFLAQALYPAGGRLVREFVGPMYDDEEAGAGPLEMGV